MNNNITKKYFEQENRNDNIYNQTFKTQKVNCRDYLNGVDTEKDILKKNDQ